MPTIQFECRRLHRTTEKVPCGVVHITCPRCPTGRGTGTRAYPMKTTANKIARLPEERREAIAARAEEIIRANL